MHPKSKRLGGAEVTCCCDRWRHSARVFAARHDGHYLGGYSVVIAESAEEAYRMMRLELANLKLDEEDIEIEEVSLDFPSVTVQFDGDY